MAKSRAQQAAIAINMKKVRKPPKSTPKGRSKISKKLDKYLLDYTIAGEKAIRGAIGAIKHKFVKTVNPYGYAYGRALKQYEDEQKAKAASKKKATKKPKK
jgi:hypothetical protein